MEDATALGIEDRVRLMRDGVVHNSAPLVSAVISIVLVPIMLKGLGLEAYGLWLAAMAISATLAGFDLGLGWGLMREVAAARGGENRHQAARFVAAAGNAYLLLGIAGGMIIGALGLPLSEGLQLSAEARELAPMVFAFVGAAFCAEWMLAVSIVVLQGTRRFGVVNLIAIFGTLLRAGGIVALLWAGSGVMMVAAWQAVSMAAIAVAANTVVARIEHQYRMRLGSLDWDSLRAHLPFGIRSACIASVHLFIWQMPQILIGIARGSPAIAPYYVGQRFPFVVANLIGRTTEVLFQAASQIRTNAGDEHARDLIEAGTRWIAALVLPTCIVLWIAGPQLLQAWMGEVRPDTLLVLRVTTAAVFVDAVSSGVLYVLWARGELGAVLLILCGMAAASIGVSLWLLEHIGLPGVAWGFLAALSLGSCAFLHLGARVLGFSILSLLRAAFHGLFLPGIACAALASGVIHLSAMEGWLEVIAAAAAGSAAYILVLYFCGARPEEKMLLQEAFAMPVTTARFANKALRRALARRSDK